MLRFKGTLMANYLVRWKSGNKTVEVRLLDKAGPLNRYEFSDNNSVVPSEGDFTNQMNQAVPIGGGWVMHKFDNARDYPANGGNVDKGTGTVDITHVGTFPKGVFDWEVVKQL